MHKRKNGFTLIEMILVMGTIAVLFAMVSPIFKNMRDKSKSILCMNNVKNISNAFMIYATEMNNGRLPLCGWYSHKVNNPVGKTAGNHGVGKPWMDTLLPYVNNNKNIFICPCDDDPDDFNFFCHGPSGSFNNDGWYSYPVDKRTKFTSCSYSANEDVVGIDNQWNTYRASGPGTSTYGGRIGGDLTKMKRSPSATILICDGSHIYVNSQKIRDMQDAEKIDADYTMDRAEFNHIDGLSVGFCDGHAGWIKKGRFSTMNLDPNDLGS
ncbi:MAG: type II secretion system protein [Candidatus Auribacterota bacterium]